MIVRFWGTRGSVATPGQATMKYGGNTSCVEVRAGKNIIILDAGTGIRDLGVSLLKEFPNTPLTVHLFLSHTHWDHIQGFPFFPVAYVPKNHIYVYGPPGRDKSLERIFQMQMDSDYFPVAFGDMSPNIKIIEMDSQVSLDGVTIQHFYLNHPAMCLAYRITEGKHSVVYATDNEPYEFTLHREKKEDSTLSEFPRYLDDKLVNFIEGTDLYIGEAQYTMDEYQSHKGWGHTPIEVLADWAVRGHVKRLALFHHDPFHDDAFVDGMVRHTESVLKSKHSSVECFGAREGLEIRID